MYCQNCDECFLFVPVSSLIHVFFNLVSFIHVSCWKQLIYSSHSLHQFIVCVCKFAVRLLTNDPSAYLLFYYNLSAHPCSTATIDLNSSPCLLFSKAQDCSMCSAVPPWLRQNTDKLCFKSPWQLPYPLGCQLLHSQVLLDTLLLWPGVSLFLFELFDCFQQNVCTWCFYQSSFSALVFILLFSRPLAAPGSRSRTNTALISSLGYCVKPRKRLPFSANLPVSFWQILTYYCRWSFFHPPLWKPE